MWECLCWANQELLFWEYLQSRERERERGWWDWSHFEEQSHTEVSHGAFWRIKEKMKEETIQRTPTLPGNLFFHAHLCWEGITWPHAPAYLCVFVSHGGDAHEFGGECVCEAQCIMGCDLSRSQEIEAHTPQSAWRLGPLCISGTKSKMSLAVCVCAL